VYIEPVRTELVQATEIQSQPNFIIGLTNQHRVELGLKPLIKSLHLTNSATAKACDMRDRNYWAHVAPDGTQPWKFFEEWGYIYIHAGENLCRDSNDVDCIRMWMASKLHRENMLNSKYEDIGVGKCGVFTVQHFGTR